MATTGASFDEEVGKEALRVYLEEEDSLDSHIDMLLAESLEDFPEDNISDSAAHHAAEIMRACRTDGTRSGHIRVIRAYITFHLRRSPKWLPKAVSHETPRHICEFITQKCGAKEKGFEGRKYATAISIRAALTFWYRSIRPNESVTEWRYDSESHVCHGLPTRSRQVSEFMIGLEKTKARAATVAEMRWGIVRYTAFLFAWLLLLVLCIEEVARLEFESIDVIPGQREHFDVRLKTRKSAQTGLTHVWTLHANDEDPKICPMRTLIRLAVLYGESIPPCGPLFLKVNQNGAIMQDAPISTGVLSRALTSDLQALGYRSWALYGTHSFRRGGCQHRIKNKGWSIDMVAAWGGWSQVEAITMFRYFYSPNDNHEYLADYDRNTCPKRFCQHSSGS